MQATGTDGNPQEVGPLGSFIDLSSPGKSWQLGWGLPPAKARIRKANLSRLSLPTMAERTGRPMARSVRPRREPAKAGSLHPSRENGAHAASGYPPLPHPHTGPKSCARTETPRHRRYRVDVAPSDRHGRPPLLQRWATLSDPERADGEPPPLQAGEDVRSPQPVCKKTEGGDRRVHAHEPDDRGDVDKERLCRRG